jgi:hypothetical protein
MGTASWIKAQEHCQFCHGLVRAGFVRFTDHENLGDLQNSGLDGLDFIAHAGAATTVTV